MDRTRVRSGLLALAFLTAACSALNRNAHIAPPQDVDMDARVLSRFQHEVEEYVELHQELLHRIPNVTPQSSAEEVAAHRAKMTRGIQEARHEAKRGEMFKPDVETAFRHVIEKELAGPQKREIVDTIRQGNPKVEGVPTSANPRAERKEPVRVAVNAVYADDAPLSSVPSELLLKLPPLPEQVKYAFVGRALILRDTEANVILDFIPDAVPDRSIPR